MHSEETSNTQTNTRQGARIEELSTKVSSANAEAGEDLAAFLINSWQQILGFIFVVLIGVVLYEQYKSTTETKIADTSNNFDVSIGNFNSLLSREPYLGKPNAEELAALVKAEGVANSLDVLGKLQLSEAGTIYGKLAGLYLAQGFIRTARLDEGLQTLKDFGAESFEIANNQLPKNPAESLVAEMAALMSARALVLKGDEKSLLAARTRLSALVNKAETVPLEALISLARLSKTTEQDQEVSDLGLQLIARFPAMSERVSSQLEEQGIEISKAKA